MNFAIIRDYSTGKHLHQSGFACTVAPYEANSFTLVDY
jgi:hypothetical protein